MGETKLSGPSMEKRLADRLKGSGHPSAASVTKQGDGPTRVITSIHPPGSHGGVVNPGQGGPLNPMKGDR
jgi:hypothetical protein